MAFDNMSPDYFGEAFRRNREEFMNSPAGLLARGWTKNTKFKTYGTGAGGMKSFAETTWTSPDGAVVYEGPTATEQAIQYAQEHPVTDASENFLNNAMFGGFSLGRAAATGALGATTRWLLDTLPKLSFSATSTAGKGLGATASNAALWGDVALATATSVPTVLDIANNGFNPVNTTELGLSMLPIFGELPVMWQNFKSRWTPYGFRVGNNAYGFNFGLLNLGMPISKTPLWLLELLPGYHIKSTMTGSPLEKQLSKNGTLSLKLLQAYVGRNDVSAIDKELLNRVIQNHIGETHIDYNTLRQEVQGMIPLYNRVPLTEYLNYGIDKLGFNIKRVSDGAGGLVDTYTGFKPNTFTFESPGIKGNTKHYSGEPIGHSRTYTTAEEPSVLHVMESLSDWALSNGITGPGKRYVEMALNNAKQDLASGNYGFYSKAELEQRILDLTKQLQNFELDPILSYMTKSYLNRQIQENLRYAALNGLTKMRYPTRESAVKIEGYEPAGAPTNKRELSDKVLSSIGWDMNKVTPYTSEIYEILLKLSKATNPKEILKLTSQLKRALNIEQRWKNKEITYSLNHETILDKYADFPKQFLKLFGKQAEIRTVTDAKGNTWYEVDVPENYLNGTAEMLFKKGGRLSPVEQFKRNLNYYYGTTKKNK